jgi:hypothetical protein
MKKRVVVGRDLTPDWIEKVGTMLKEIFRQMCLWFKEPGKGLSLDQLQLFIEHQNPFGRVTTLVTDIYENIRRDWESFYENNFNLKADFSNIRIPKFPGLGWRLLIIAKGVDPEQVFQLSKKIFGRAWKYYDASLDVVVVKNERSNKDNAYAIWVRNGQEADEIHKNKSANQVEAEKLLTETCLERLIHGFKYFKETNKHLDIETTTLCSGSRYSDGGVPFMHWSSINDGFHVGYYYIDVADDGLRAREVVS